MSFQLRPYQVRAVEKLRAAAGNRPILVMPPGSGKTGAAVNVIYRALKDGHRAAFVVHRRELLDQASDRLKSVGLDPGLFVAGERVDLSRPVQVCSIQTLYRRLPNVPSAQVVIFDEAHHCVSDTYQKVVEAYSTSTIIGLTATPYRLDGKGLGRLFGEVVEPTSYDELARENVLIFPTVYAPDEPNMRGVRKVAGDYSMAAALPLMEKLTGRVVEHWLRHRPGRTVLFGCTVDHCRLLVAAFNAAGVSSEVLHYATPKDERAETLLRLRAGTTQLVACVTLLTEGWDLQELACVSIARPTASRALHVQMVGRSMRTAPGKTSALVLDHAGNHPRHGFAWDPHEYTLADGLVESASAPAPGKQCPECFAFYVGRVCPQCGHEPEPEPAPEETDEQLAVFRGRRAAPESEKRELYRAMLLEASYCNYKLAWARHSYRRNFGVWPRFADLERSTYTCTRHGEEKEDKVYGWKRAVRCARCLQPLTAQPQRSSH